MKAKKQIKKYNLIKNALEVLLQDSDIVSSIHEEFGQDILYAWIDEASASIAQKKISTSTAKNKPEKFANDVIRNLYEYPLDNKFVFNKITEQLYLNYNDMDPKKDILMDNGKLPEEIANIAIDYATLTNDELVLYSFNFYINKISSSKILDLMQTTSSELVELAEGEYGFIQNAKALMQQIDDEVLTNVHLECAGELFHQLKVTLQHLREVEYIHDFHIREPLDVFTPTLLGLDLSGLFDYSAIESIE